MKKLLFILALVIPTIGGIYAQTDIKTYFEAGIAEIGRAHV